MMLNRSTMPRQVCAFVLVLLLFLPGCGSKGTVTEERSQEPQTGKELHLYTALDSNEAKLYIEAFKKKTGIDVKWVRLSSGEVLTRIRNEKNNPQVSLWFGGPFTDYIAAKEEGLLTLYKPVVDFVFPPGSHDAEFFWTGISFGAIGFVSNTEILKRRGLEAPDSWQDLIRPEFRGEISLAYAYTSGTAYTILATLVQFMGEKKAFEYIRKLDANVHHYNKSGSACVTQAGLGEVGVCVTFSQDALKKGVSKGYPVVLSFPKEGTGYEYAAAALVKGGPEPELAKQFIDWLLSSEAQKMMVESYRIPVNTRVPPGEKSPGPKDLRLIDFDAEKAGREKRALMESWREITKQ